MKPLLVGDPSIFAIESKISVAYEQLGFKALGYFIIHVAGKSFGVRTWDASLLACSLDAVRARFAGRGTHEAGFGSEPNAVNVAEAMYFSVYREVPAHCRFFGLTADEFTDALYKTNTIWAPDGDECFDDGGMVMQFDVGDQVRLIAFMNAEYRDEMVASVAEAWMPADTYYEILDRWQSAFEAQWAAAPKVPIGLGPPVEPID